MCDYELLTHAPLLGETMLASDVGDADLTLRQRMTSLMKLMVLRVCPMPSPVELLFMPTTEFLELGVAVAQVMWALTPRSNADAD